SSVSARIGKTSDAAVAAMAATTFVDLTSVAKPLYLNGPESRTKGRRLGSQRHQSHHRFDEEERSLGVRDGEGRLSIETAKGSRRSTGRLRAGDNAAVTRSNGVASGDRARS